MEVSMRAFVLLIMIAVLLGVPGCSSQEVDDSAITVKVKSKLAADSKTSAIKIGVETKDGVVTLSGTVPTTTEKDEAEKLAKNTEGVKRVTNSITVDPSSLGATNVREKAGEAAKNISETVSDATILTKLKAKLVADGITGTDIDVENGKVVLKGQVDDAKKKAKAEEIAKSTAGVKDVKNQLTVKKNASS
jgi:hyperosmotically inducible periplasmic protein